MIVAVQDFSRLWTMRSMSCAVGSTSVIIGTGMILRSSLTCLHGASTREGSAWPTCGSSARGLRDGIEADAGRDAEAIEEVQQVLRREVARRARGVGAPPSPPAEASKVETPVSRPAWTLTNAIPRVSWR